MGERLKAGQQIQTLTPGKPITVKRYLAEGGQGEVYIVDYDGQDRALKWYKKVGLGADPDAFYKNISNNIARGNPSPEFLWPIDLTEWIDGTFGYVMDLRPEGYHEITEFLLCHVRFKSFRTIVDAALGIVSAFRILHNSGYSYQDLNDGNFFIHPQTGKVLICDNDNVAQDGEVTGILGKPRYMAPEIVRGDGKPNSLTDRFSMSLILYMLFCLNHPLEGRRSLAPALTPALQGQLYGSEPIFMMDPDDTRNSAHPNIHKNSLVLWQYLPNYMQEIFLKAFCKKGLEKPSARPREIEWLNVLTRFRSEIVPCTCSNEVFTQEGAPTQCDGCGKMIAIPYKLSFGGYSIPAVAGTRVYRCQIGVCDEKEALTPIAQILARQDTGELGIKNRSGSRWNAVTSKGDARKVAPDEVIPVKAGITFVVSDCTIEIKSN